MGAKYSCSRTRATIKEDELSIFQLLLQLTRIGGTDTDDDEHDLLFLRLLDTPISDVSYDAIEIYCRNFIVDSLFSANLRHGNLYHYWDRYAALLEQIVQNEKPESTGNNAPLEVPVVSGGNESEGCRNVVPRCESESSLAEPVALCTNHKKNGNVPCASSIAEGTKKQHSGERNTKKNLFAKLAKHYASGTKEANLDGKRCTPETIDGSYFGLLSGKVNVTRFLSIFVVSRMLCKSMIEKINTAELLFHMDYLPYCAKSGRISFFESVKDREDASEIKIKVAQEVPGDDAGDQKWDHNKEEERVLKLTKEKGDEVMNPAKEESSETNSSSSFVPTRELTVEGDSAGANIEKEPGNFKNLVLIHCREERKMTVQVSDGAPSSEIVDMIIEEATQEWSRGTNEALRSGFCLVDSRMRIFSLQNLSHILKHANHEVEFMVLPFFTIRHGNDGASHLQRLINAVYSYATATIQPQSSAHEVFLKASQSMAADVLTMLLSCIVMKPYLFTDNKEQDTPLPDGLKWVNELPGSIRAVAPLYYIQMDKLWSQLMLEVPKDESEGDSQLGMEWVIKKKEHMKYGILSCFDTAIGKHGLEHIGSCLIGAIKCDSSSGCKMHLENLRNHFALLILLLLGYKDPEELSDSGSTDIFGSMKDNGDASGMTSLDRIENILGKAGIQLPQLTVCLQERESIDNGRKLDTQLSQDVIVGIANALAGMNHSKLCSNELLLVLVDLFSTSQCFELVFYRASNGLIKEILHCIKKHCSGTKAVTEGSITRMSPLVRTMTRILSHHVKHHKKNDIDNLSLDPGTVLLTIAEMLQWNFEFQKDDLLVTSAISLINQMLEIPVVLSRNAPERMMKLLCSWISTANTYMEQIYANEDHDLVTTINVIMLLQMVFAMLVVIKHALSLRTLDSNLPLVNATLNVCHLETLESLIYHLKDSKLDAISELYRMEPIRKQTIELLTFVSLLIRTFLGYKIHSMHSFTGSMPGFPSNAVCVAISDLIREINEEASDTKSALALAIAQELEPQRLPKPRKRDLHEYQMAQLWTAAYKHQNKFTLWKYSGTC